MNTDRDQFCQQCGTQLVESGYPKTCSNCRAIIWSNPLPVAVCVQPIIDRSFLPYRVGLAIAQRAIEPKLGTWCFLGGHVEHGETFEGAARREFLEETSHRCFTGLNPRITGSYQNGHGHVLVAVEFDALDIEYWENAKLCPENSAFGVLWKDSISVDGTPLELGFPIHQTIAERWMNPHARYNPH